MNNCDLIGMAWADRISFEEIKKRTGFQKKKLSQLWERNLKKKAIYYGERE